MGLRIRTLGKFEVYRDEHLISGRAWKTLKNKQLVKILLTHHGHALAQDQLIEWLWPEFGPKRGIRSLRVAVSHVRRLLEPDLPRGSKDSYVLKTDAGYAWNTEKAYWLDALAFDAVCAELEGVWDETMWEQAEQARALYRGRYLEEDRYADWTAARRERLQERYLALLLRLAEAHAQTKSYAKAVALCRQALQIDPCRENVWRQLMEHHYQAGDRALALKAYGDCQRALAEALDVEPMPQTQALYRSMRGRQPIQSASTPPHNLPQPLTRFIGRQDELQRIEARLNEPSCRLLTLVGPGGNGKSRLALEAASRLLKSFVDGVFWVPLAAVDAAEGVGGEIGKALRLTFDGRESQKEQLFHSLRDRRLLLVLDNFEHLLEAVPLLVELLQNTTNLKLLITSRQRLNALAESVLEVPGLAFPAEDVAQGDDDEAILLFMERARSVLGTFTPSKTDRAAVARLCRQVQGMPLALELAAGWLKVMSCAEISRELDKSLDLLSSRAGDLPPRHRSLRAVFDHSWALLSGDEQGALQRLAVFQGGFEREGAVTVARCTPAQLLALVDKSLVERTRPGRYDVHPLLRQYALERFSAAAAGLERARDDYCAFFMGFLKRRRGALQGVRQAIALQEIDEERDNVRAAWRWAIRRRRVASLSDGLDGLYQFCRLRGEYVEGNRLLEEAEHALRANPTLPSPQREGLLGKILARRGRLCHRLGDYQQAQSLLQESGKIFQAQGLKEELAFALHGLGSIAYMQNDHEVARRLCEQGLSLVQEVGDIRGQMRALNTLGLIAQAQGRYREGQLLFHRSLRLAQAQGDVRQCALALAYVGLSLNQSGRYAKAQAFCHQSAQLAQSVGDPWLVSLALDYEGHAHWSLGAHEQAQVLYQRSLALRQRSGNRWGIAAGRYNLGKAALAAGELDAAKAHFEHGLSLFESLGDQPGIGSSLLGLGLVFARLGQQEKAEQWLRKSLAVFERIPDQPKIVETFNHLGKLAAQAGETQTAERHHLRALEMALALGLIPVVLDSLVGVAVAVALGSRKPAEAFELARFVANRAESDVETRRRAQELCEALKARLPTSTRSRLESGLGGKTIQAVGRETLARLADR